MALHPPGQVECVIHHPPPAPVEVRVCAARWWCSPRVKLSVPPLPEPVEGAYVQRDCGTVTGASSVWPPHPEPVEVRGVCGKMAVQSPVQVQLCLHPLRQSKCACVQCDGGTVTGSSSVWPPLPEPVEVRGGSGEMTVQPQGQVQL